MTSLAARLPHWSIAALAVIAVAALSACGDSDDPALSPRTEAEVSMVASRFTPREVVVAAGAAVTFVNTDPFAHTVDGRVGTAAEALVDSDRLAEGEAFSVTFSDAGTFDYFCEIHPTMTGTVVVV